MYPFSAHRHITTLCNLLMIACETKDENAKQYLFGDAEYNGIRGIAELIKDLSGLSNDAYNKRYNANDNGGNA